MTDSPEALSGNLPTFSVSEIAQAVKRTLETSFERVRIRGEISRPNYHASGHLYFTLKDESAVIDAVCWRGRVSALSLRAEQGLEVIVTGRLSSYPGSSKYQIVIEQMELAGEGAILKMLEERRKRLAAEGLFAPERKRPLPFLPQVIGVITSPTGAVIRDILHRLAERFPRRVLVWPVRVQGEGAAAEIVAAIEGFNRLEVGGAVPRPDLLIVARGGGSLEDLMPFNEEAVVRAAANSKIPLISAVGHETDTTLIDFASDLRAPTPTAAAEKAVPVRADLLLEISSLGERQVKGLARLLRERRQEVLGLGRALPEPRRLLEEATQRLDERATRLNLALARAIERRRALTGELGARLIHPSQQLILSKERLATFSQRLAPPVARRLKEAQGELAAQARLLESLSHKSVLERGFVFVEDAKGVVTRASQVAPGDALSLTFADGKVAVRAEGGEPKKKAAPPKQGSLL